MSAETSNQLPKEVQEIADRIASAVGDLKTFLAKGQMQKVLFADDDGGLDCGQELPDIMLTFGFDESRISLLFAFQDWALLSHDLVTDEIYELRSPEVSAPQETAE